MSGWSVVMHMHALVLVVLSVLSLNGPCTPGYGTITTEHYAFSLTNKKLNLT